jgi:VIT1/CCC1 family predicted Fe2+/Mn2+ transporter
VDETRSDVVGIDADRSERTIQGAVTLATPLGPAVGATTTAPPGSRHRERHHRRNSLRDVILGGQDGLVNILGIILGVIAGGGSNTVLVATGFAAAITESISMGAVGYTSMVSERDYYQAERQRESTEIATMPDAERQEIRDIYGAKGFSGDLLDRVVDTIVSNRETWLATMMDEELHLRPVDCDRPQLGGDHDRHARRAPDPPFPVPGARSDAGTDLGDRAQRPRPVRGGRLLGGHPRRRLAQQRPEDGRYRPRSCFRRLLDRPVVPFGGRVSTGCP